MFLLGSLLPHTRQAHFLLQLLHFFHFLRIILVSFFPKVHLVKWEVRFRRLNSKLTPLGMNPTTMFQLHRTGLWREQCHPGSPTTSFFPATISECCRNGRFRHCVVHRKQSILRVLTQQQLLIKTECPDCMRHHCGLILLSNRDFPKESERFPWLTATSTLRSQAQQDPKKKKETKANLGLRNSYQFLTCLRTEIFFLSLLNLTKDIKSNFY